MPVTLHVSDLSVSYDGVSAVEGVSLTVPGGTCVAIVGPGGAGKSSVVRAVTGHLRAPGARVLLDGHDVTRLTPDGRARAGLAHALDEGCPATPTWLTITVHDVLVRAASSAGGQVDAVGSAIELVPEVAALTGRRVDRLDAAERRLVAIARALAGAPTVLVLDEPSCGLPATPTGQVVDAVRRVRAAGTTVLLAEQRIDVVSAVADEVYVMRHGHFSHRLRADDPDLAASAHGACFS